MSTSLVGLADLLLIYIMLELHIWLNLFSSFFFFCNLFSQPPPSTGAHNRIRMFTWMVDVSVLNTYFVNTHTHTHMHSCRYTHTHTQTKLTHLHTRSLRSNVQRKEMLRTFFNDGVHIYGVHFKSHSMVCVVGLSCGKIKYPECKIF